MAAARRLAARRADAAGAVGGADRLGARRTARPPAEGVRQARPLAALGAAPGRDRPLQLDADLAGAGPQGGDRLRDLLHIAGRGRLSGAPRRAVPLPRAGADSRARGSGGSVRRRQRLLRRPHGAVPADSRREDGRRSARHRPRRLRAGGAGPVPAVHRRLSRPHRAGEGDPPPLRRLAPPACAGRSGGLPARTGGLSRSGAPGVLRRRAAPGPRPGARRGDPLPGRAGTRRQGGVPPASRPVRRAGDVRRSEGPVPDRGAGVRRAGGGGPARHLRRAARAHRGRRADRARRRRGAGGRAAPAARRRAASP